jgi:hypothetical protein
MVYGEAEWDGVSDGWGGGMAHCTRLTSSSRFKISAPVLSLDMGLVLLSTEPILTERLHVDTNNQQLQGCLAKR